MYYSRSGSGTNQDPGQDIDSPELYIPRDERLGKNKISCMKRRVFLKRYGAASLLGPVRDYPIHRMHPSDPGWPAKQEWKRLDDAVGGNLIPVDFPLNGCMSSSQCAECQALLANLKIPI